MVSSGILPFVLRFARRSTLRSTLIAAGAVLVAAPGIAQVSVKLLPQPREAHFSGEVAIPAGIRAEAPGRDPEDEFAARDFEEAAAGLGQRSDASYRVVLLRAGSAEGKQALAANQLSLSPEMAAEGYILAIAPDHAVIVAESATGIFYGVQTLRQLLPLPGARR